jgi:hypothetical protein
LLFWALFPRLLQDYPLDTMPDQSIRQCRSMTIPPPSVALSQFGRTTGIKTVY